MLAETLSFLVALTLSAAILSQVVIPAIFGRPLLPLLRRSRRAAERRLEGARAGLDEAELEAEASSDEDRARKLKNGEK